MNSSDSETESSNSQTLLDNHQCTSKDKSTMNDSSEMEVQEGETNTSLQKANMAGHIAICSNGSSSSIG